MSSSTRQQQPQRHSNRTSKSPPLSPIQQQHQNRQSPTQTATATASPNATTTSPTQRRTTSSSPHSNPNQNSPQANSSGSPTGSSSAGSSSSPGPGGTANQSPGGAGGGGGGARRQMRRVKLYRLKDDKWIDLGTGNCSGMILEAPASAAGSPDGVVVPGVEEAWIVVRKEGQGGGTTPLGMGLDDDDILLKSKIQPPAGGYASDEDDDEETTLEGSQGNKVLEVGGYQKQQDTLIVWTDRETEMDMALSFATPHGCGEIWEFIKASRKFNSENFLTSPSPSPSLSSPQHFPLYSTSASLPEPSFANLDSVETAVRSLSRTVVGRERTALLIFKSGYVQKLIRIHEEAVDLESIEDLHKLCRIMQSILLLNDNAIFDLILRDDVILGVVSILEYDPEFPTMKASYRAHLSDPTHFTQVVPIRSPTLLAKIHQTHRLYYLKDVVLARVVEDSTFSMLNSAIYFNEVDIVNEVAGDPTFLMELFALFDEGVEEGGAKGKGKAKAKVGPQVPTELETKMDVDATSSSPSQAAARTEAAASLTKRKNDAILFLQQFALMAKNLQIPIRSAFFRNLADRGLLKVIEVALASTETADDPRIKAATIEILMTLVDHDPNNVRGYSLKQHANQKRPLVVFLIELFHKEEDLGLKAQMSEALRVLVDAIGEGGPLEAPPRLRQEDPEAEKFLQYFYDHCINSLLAPILELPAISPTDPPLELSITQVALCTHLCDLLCFFVSHHSFRSKYFCLSSSISMSVSKLFRTQHKHLRLAALRYFRACVGRNDEFYNRFMTKNDLFHPILEVTKAERGRDNLLASACLDFFEYIRAMNPKLVINHLMERYGETMRQLALTLKTFANLILKWEQNNEPPPKESASLATATSTSMTREGRSWAGTSRMDVEEESYFNGSDDEDSATPASRKREAEPDEGDRKRVRFENGTAPLSLPRSKTWPTASEKAKGKGLVDYGDEDDDDEPGGFVKEATEAESIAAAEEEIGPPPPPLGSKEEDEEDPLERLQRMRAEKAGEEEEEGTLGLLSARKDKKSPPKASTASASAKGGSGFKIAFGRSPTLAKLTGAAAKEEEAEKG